MAIYAVGIITSYERKGRGYKDIVVGFNLYDTKNEVTKPILQHILREGLCAGKIKVENIELKDGELVGTQGSLMKLPIMDTAGNLQSFDGLYRVTVLHKAGDKLCCVDCKGKYLEIDSLNAYNKIKLFRKVVDKYGDVIDNTTLRLKRRVGVTTKDKIRESTWVNEDLFEYDANTLKLVGLTNAKMRMNDKGRIYPQGINWEIPEKLVKSDQKVADATKILGLMGSLDQGIGVEGNTCIITEAMDKKMFVVPDGFEKVIIQGGTYNTARGYKHTHIVLPKTCKVLESDKSVYWVNGINCDYLENIADGALEGSEIASVEFGERLRVIGDSAFNRCNQLESVDFTRTKKDIRIGIKAFYRCEKLKSVDLTGAKITKIDRAAFYMCKQLEEVSGIGAIEEIEKEVFCSCSSLKSIDLSKARYVGSKAFYTTAIRRADLSSCRGLGREAFQLCRSLMEVRLPASMELLRESTFRDCSNLYKINLENIKAIGGRAFRNCSKLGNLDLHSIETLDSKSFYHCRLRNVQLGKNVKRVSSEAFLGNLGMKLYFYEESREVAETYISLMSEKDRKENFHEVYVGNERLQ